MQSVKVENIRELGFDSKEFIELDLCKKIEGYSSDLGEMNAQEEKEFLPEQIENKEINRMNIGT